MKIFHLRNYLILFSCVFSSLISFKSFSSYRRSNSLLDSIQSVVATDSTTDTKDMKKFMPKRFVKFPFDYHERVSITISDVTNLGSGVGRKVLSDGSKWVIHVPYTLPGEEIICQIYQNHKSYSEADLIEIKKPSEDRVQPQCQYFGTCGGCQYQHMSMEAQRKWKKQQVVQLLTRIGGFHIQGSETNNHNSIIHDNADTISFDSIIENDDIESQSSDNDQSTSTQTSTTNSNDSDNDNDNDVRSFTSDLPILIPAVNDVIGTSEVDGYRAKLTPHYDSPMKQVKPGQVLSEQDIRIGFQMKSFRRIVDIEQCIIALPDVNQEYLKTRNQLKNLFISLTNSSASTTGTTSFDPFSSNKPKIKLPKNGATLLFRQVDEGVITDSRQIVTHTINNISYKFKAGEFFQNNLYILPHMIQYVLDQAKGDGCEILIDTYCGSGLFALASSIHFQKIWGIEISEQAIEFAKFSAEYNNITNTEFICGSSENIFEVVSNVIPTNKRKEVVVIIDPPRAGCNEIFLDQLFTFSPKKLVYVSCDPATQARDAKIICAKGYKIQSVQPFDFFPQTRHIENVIVFIRD